MTSVRQDLWFGWDSRRRGLRLRPFAGAATRLLVKPPPAVSLDAPPWRALIEQLADRSEVIAYESPTADFGVLTQDLGRALAHIHAHYRDGLPLVLLGFGVSATAALAFADHPFVAGLVAMAAAPPFAAHDPSVLARALEDLALDAHLQPAARPLLVLDATDADGRLRELLATTVARRSDSARIEIAADGAALLRSPWPEVVSAWAIQVTRGVAGAQNGGSAP
jgi:hypothetical protein